MRRYQNNSNQEENPTLVKKCLVFSKFTSSTPLGHFVSALKSDTQKLDKFSANIVQPLKEKTASYVKNSELLLQILIAKREHFFRSSNHHFLKKALISYSTTLQTNKWSFNGFVIITYNWQYTLDIFRSKTNRKRNTY